MIVEDKNGKRSEKFGCKGGHPLHSVFQMNNKISIIRVKEMNGCFVCGIELLDKSRKTIWKFDVYPLGDWKEHHL
jgi:hypothetical protein